MISLRVLGPVDLRKNDQAVHTLLAQPKRLALLAFVCSEGSQEFVRRDVITSLFWPERDNERARAALRTSLHALRAGLGDLLVTRGNDELKLAPDAIQYDAAAFASACAGGEWARALELYRGDFLAGLHVYDAAELDRWIEEQRTRHRVMARTAAWRCADVEEGRGNLAAALELGRRAMTLDGRDEVGLRHLLRLYDALGDRAGALGAFEAFSARLRAELDVEPGPETLALVKSLRRGRLADPVVHGAAAQAADVAGVAPAAPGGSESGSGDAGARRWNGRRLRAIWPVAGGAGLALALLGAWWVWNRAASGMRAAPASGQVSELAAGVRGFLRIADVPSPLSHMAAVYDAVHDKVYSVAGVDGRVKTNDVWELDRPGGAVTAGWTRLEPQGTQPRPRLGPSAVYDSTTDRLIMFGGALGTTAPCANDVWILANPSRRGGSPQWLELEVGGDAPPPRAEHWAVWVPGKRRMIVFGGHDCIAKRMDDTWAIDLPADPGAGPAAWRRLATSGAVPPGRSHHTAVYDEANDRVIVMGGYADKVIYDDVWELKPASSEAAAWRQLRVRGGRPMLSAHRAVWDPVKRQMLVFGGTGADGPDRTNPVWAMRDVREGTVQWSRLEGLPSTPPLRWSHAMVYNSARDQLIVFGGTTTGGVLTDAWVLMNVSERRSREGGM